MSSGNWRPFCLGLNVLKTSYDPIPVKGTTGQNVSRPCNCTPKCEQNIYIYIYRLSVSQADVSKAILRAVSVHANPCPYWKCQSFGRLCNHVHNEHSTGCQLSIVTRKDVVNIATKVAYYRQDIHRNYLEIAHCHQRISYRTWRTT